jgi:hypothetical protein
MASDTVGDPYEIVLCPIAGHHRRIRRKEDLALRVEHDKTDELMIWSHMGEVVVHDRLLEELGRRGISGYRLRSATVRFRDGHLTVIMHLTKSTARGTLWIA